MMRNSILPWAAPDLTWPGGDYCANRSIKVVLLILMIFNCIVS